MWTAAALDALIEAAYADIRARLGVADRMSAAGFEKPAYKAEPRT